MTATNSDLWVQGSALGPSSDLFLNKRVLTYNLGDRVVLINGLTSAIDELTSKQYVQLTMDPKELAVRDPSLANELARRGYLFSEPEGEFLLENRLIENIERAAIEKEMVFMMCPTDFCPVGCSYCFAEDRALKARREVMSPEMIDSAFLSIEEIRRRYPSRLSTMCLYGGEPFQDFTRDTLEHIFKRSRELGLRIAGFTSGLHAYKFKDLLESYKECIKTIAVTLDGTEASHQSMRKMGDVYPKAIATIDVLLEIGIPVLIKSNVNRFNIADLPRLVELYKEKGWWDNPLTSYELTPIQYRQIKLERDTNFDLEMAFEFFDMRANHPELERFDILPMADNKYGLLDGFGFHRFPKANIPMQAAVPRVHSCPSYSKHFFVFTADGNFYLCNEEVGLNASSFGTFVQDTQNGCSAHRIDYGRMENYYKRDVRTLNPCKNCPYSFFCGGGCGHHAGGEHIAMCGTIHVDFGEVVRRWAKVDKLPDLPLTGIQRSLAESIMKPFVSGQSN